MGRGWSDNSADSVNSTSGRHWAQVKDGSDEKNIAAQKAGSDGVKVEEAGVPRPEVVELLTSWVHGLGTPKTAGDLQAALMNCAPEFYED